MRMPFYLVVLSAFFLLFAAGSPVEYAAAGSAPLPLERFTAEFDDDLGEDEDDDLAAFQREVARDLREFRDERDRDFAEFLAEQWKEFEELAGLVASRIPKPVTVPVAVSKPTDKVPPGGKTIEPPAPAPAPMPAPPVPEPTLAPPVPEPVPTLPAPVPAPTPPAPPATEPAPVPLTPAPVPAPPLPEPVPLPSTPSAGKPGNLQVDFDFHELELEVFYDPQLSISLDPKINNLAISDCWKQLSMADFPPLVSQVEKLRGELRLNDWGYFQLVHALADRLQKGPNEATLFSWFLLNKSGYWAKVGFSEGKLFLLVPSDNVIYQVPYFTQDETKYYNLTAYRSGGNAGNLFIYKENYPGADHRLNLGLVQTPLLKSVAEPRKLQFRYGGKNHEIAVSASRSLVRFLEGYPQTDLPIFFDASASTEAEESLLASLRPLIAGKTETEAVNLLLRFVQTAFAYKTDDQQFGREKYLFVDETVFFPYSDCEDRSILFSFLVRRLTGLDVIGLLYPGHVATAVRFTGEVKGDRVTIDGKSYVVCDPTYINANLGMTMTQFKGVKPEVIVVGL